MDCKEFQNYVNRYVDMELDIDNEQECKKHLENCVECRKIFESLRETHDKLEQLFTPKDVPLGMEERIINNLPKQKNRFNFNGLRFTKRARGIVFSLMLIFIVIGIYNYKDYVLKLGVPKSKSADLVADYDMAAIVRVNNTEYYRVSDEVITDDRMIDKEIASINVKLNGGDKLQSDGSWVSTIADVGTKVYSIKGISENEAVALKIHDEWNIFRVKVGRSEYPIFTEDMLRAEKVVVRYVGSGNNESKEIIDKQVINKMALTMENAEKLSNIPSFYGGGKRYEFYFVNKDSNGIGEIAHKYFITMQDVNLSGYIDTIRNNSYKVTSEFNKIITSPFDNETSLYDERLGGKQQIYDAFVGGKIIFRKFINEETGAKSEITLLDKEADIWENGCQVKDNLKGNYKLQIIMKDTTVQKSVMEKATQDISKVPNLEGIYFEEGSGKDTTVIYICFNTKPAYDVSEGGDSLVIVQLNK